MEWLTMRTMDEILDDEPRDEITPGEFSESGGEVEAAETASETPAESPEAPAEPAETVADGEDGDPEDVSGYRRALAAAREDKRRARTERQEARQELAKLQGRLQEIEKSRQAPKEDAVEPFDNFIGNPTGFIGEQVGAMSREFDAKLFKKTADMSEHYARRDHEDYDEAKAKFNEVASQPGNEWMWNPVVNAALPAEVVYQEGRKLLGGDPDASEKDARITELEAELAAARDGKPPAKPIPPKSNATARGSGPKPKTWAGPRSMDDILA
jgi:hypothetical protein